MERGKGGEGIHTSEGSISLSNNKKGGKRGAGFHLKMKDGPQKRRTEGKKGGEKGGKGKRTGTKNK